MEWWQVIGIVLGSNVIVETLKILATKKSDQRKRKETLEDKKMAKDDQTKTLEDRFTQFCEMQKRENSDIRQRLSGVETTLGTLCENTSAAEYIAIRKEALEHVKHGEIDAEDRVLLKERYERYRSISHKKDLDNIMNEVDNLRTKQ